MGFIGKQPAKAAMTSSDITDGIVSADKLASDSVTTAKIADNGVTTAKINADAVTDAKIADDVVGTEHLTAGEVDTTALGADAVTAAKIADDAISDEHLDPTAITGQTAETSAADDDLILLSDTSASAALKKMTRSNFLSGVGGSNTPAFQARISSTQNLSDASYTKMAAATEDFDTDGTYDHSTNYRFTPGVAGKFMFYGAANFDSSSTDDLLQFRIALYKNGTRIMSTLNLPVSKHYNYTSNFNFIDTSDNDDYYECYLYLDITSNTPQAIFESSVGRTFWGAYKIIT